VPRALGTPILPPTKQQGISVSGDETLVY
jgi:hypothetical protein